MSRFPRKQVGLALTNAVVMLLLTFWFMTLSYVQGDEQNIMEFGAKLRNVVLGLEEKPPHENFLFINVAYDKQLVEKTDEAGFSVGQEAITDRRLLARLLTLMATNPTNQKFILLDVHLDNRLDTLTGSDSTDRQIEEAAARLPNFVASHHLDEDGLLQPLAVNVPFAISDYIETNGMFLKFRLVHHGHKTLPLVMYERLNGHELISSNRFQTHLNDGYYFTTFIPRMRIRQYDLFYASVEERYAVDNLTNMFQGAMTEEDILDYLKDRIVVIGDFEDRDIHETLYGETAGPLILVNAYLGLVYGDGKIGIALIGFLFLAYFLVSLTIFIAPDFLTRRLPRKFAPYLVNAAGYSFAMVFISSVAILMFDYYLSLLYLTVYLFGVAWVHGKLTRSS